MINEMQIKLFTIMPFLNICIDFSLDRHILIMMAAILQIILDVARFPK